ncbi:MAG: GNAT family N-acetyltransferase [Ignavibacteria bacterium]|jgi:RimJ/RimL family protein N-acetyltransferase|nr:GNAT family N-acetyltransferase [Ignavibacteria bacterium]MCU7504334.1 GNAT family N-acetyltransferase [Ignavibacteria bacterium]MCU7518179.1 GNAT family N-acetyltransferase [Ignavibacteria bacterium]
MVIDLGICRIRPWKFTDKESLAHYANNWNIWINLRDAFPHPYTVDDAEVWLNMVVNKKPVTQFAIEVDEKAVGAIGFIIKEDVQRIQAEIGYWLAEEFWGHGIASAALKAVSEYAFHNFDIHRIYADVFEWNKASLRVLEKAGFELEVRQKKSIIKNGEIIDLFVYVKNR